MILLGGVLIALVALAGILSSRARLSLAQARCQAEREARLAAEHYAESLENELFKVRAISAAQPGERTVSAIRRLLVSARSRDDRKVWS
jgi:uncharacterized protein YciW